MPLGDDFDGAVGWEPGDLVPERLPLARDDLLRADRVPRWKRPVVANNGIALLETPGRVGLAARQFLANVVARGRGHSPYDVVGSAGFD